MNPYLQILHEDNHLIAVNKPAGWLVQGDQTGDRPLVEYVKDYIRDRYNKPGAVFLGVIHRLDRPVSGVVVFARTSKGLERMNKLFRDREIEKTYWAVTRERPNPYTGHLTHYIYKNREINKSTALDKPSKRHSDAKKADLDYSLLASVDGSHLLKVNPITGRPHQIRVQLSSMGTPIYGDIKYGADQPTEDGTICLHCRSLSFVHPVKKEPVYIEADPPMELQVWKKFQHLI
ncbi:MAG: RluA family pseudouridine synthase [Bacteroidetes bacterium]|nr:RluA family pseudouridine synthase [Bacteroidota bacterium]